MKKLKQIVPVLLAILLSGVGMAQDKDVNAVLNDPAKQEQFIAALVKDHQLMKKFSEKMLEDDHALGMVMDAALIRAESDTTVSRSLAELVGRHHKVSIVFVDHIMGIAEDVPAMNHQICKELLEHEEMKKNMCEHMKEDAKSGGAGCCTMHDGMQKKKK